jgi:hypothetical protein
MSPENPAILSAMVRVVTSRIVATAHRARTMPVAGVTASCGAPTRLRSHRKSTLIAKRKPASRYLETFGKI